LAAEKQVVPLACLHLHWDLTTRDGGTMAHEEWRDIPGFDGYYQASNLGRIRGLERLVPSKQFGTKRIPARMMSQSISGPGYYQVMLTKFGKQRPYYVHRLVASAFIENPDNLPAVDHIDANKLNNKIENLRWVTQKENVANTRRHGDAYDGTANITNPINRAKALLSSSRPVIRNDGRCYASISDAARDIGVRRQSVLRVVNDQTGKKKCKGYTFKDIEKETPKK